MSCIVAFDMRGDPVIPGRWYWARNDSVICASTIYNSARTVCFVMHDGTIEPCYNFTDIVPVDLPKEYERR